VVLMASEEDSGALIERWRTNLELFRRELTYLLWSRQIYRRYRDIVLGNATIQDPWTFHDWVVRNYVTAVVMAGRRLLDRHRDSVSFVKLLLEIQARPGVITREVYRAHFAQRNLEADRILNLPDREFDRLAGAGATALGTHVVQRDIELLAEAWKPFKALADQHIAHRDPRAQPEMPTYAELDAAIDAIHPVLKRYELLLLGVATSPGPVAQFDWDVVFRQAWLEPLPELEDE
jgi:hypothetical protein